MPKYAYVLGAGLSLAVAFAVQAQTPVQAPAATAGQASSATTAPPTPGIAPTSAADFKPGATVKDSDGVTIGTVVKAGAAANGQLAVVIDMDGKSVSLPANLFLVAGDLVTAQATKAQIQAAMAKG
jgi:hypothetical protein